MSRYGPDFADVYRRHWHGFGARLWPFLSKVVRGREPTGTPWLDLCCGAGSLLEILCREGYPCVGLDISRQQLAHARRCAPQARLIEADVRRFSLRRRFGVVTCLFDSLNYLGRVAEVAGVLRRVRRHLRSDGVFIFDVNTVRVFREKWPGQWVIEEPRRVVCVLGSCNEGDRSGRCHITGFVKTGRLWRRFDEEHLQIALEREDLEPALAAAGLRFAAYDGEKFTRVRGAPRRLLYVCRPEAGSAGAPGR